MEPSEYVEQLEQRVCRMEEQLSQLKYIVETATAWEEEAAWEAYYRDGLVTAPEEWERASL